MPYGARSHQVCQGLSPSLSLSLLDRVCHEPLLGAVRAQDVLAVRDEALADHGRLAGGAEEAVVVPVATFERDEARAADACGEEGEEGRGRGERTGG